MSNEASVRVGVIGTGIMGERHLRVYSQSPGASVVGVFDPDPVRAAEVTRRHGGAVFPTAAALLREVDAVSVASPTRTHAEMAMLALDHGVHLLIEKPMTHTLRTAEELAARAATANGTAILIGHIERFNPVVAELRRLLAGQHLDSITVRRMSPFTDRCLDSDVVHDLMIHDIDLMVGLFGDRLQCLDAAGSTVRSQRIDHAVAWFAVAGGPSVTLIASRVAPEKVQGIDVEAGGVHFSADLLEKTITVTQREAVTPPAADTGVGHRDAHGTEHISVLGIEPLRMELEHFLDCARGKSTPVVGVEAGLLAMTHAAAIIDLIEQRAMAGVSPDLLTASVQG